MIVSQAIGLLNGTGDEIIKRRRGTDEEEQQQKVDQWNELMSHEIRKAMMYPKLKRNSSERLTGGILRGQFIFVIISTPCRCNWNAMLINQDDLALYLGLTSYSLRI